MTLDDVLFTYGDPRSDPRAFVAANIVLFDLPYPMLYGQLTVTRSQAHRLAVPKFCDALTRVKQRGLVAKALHYGGIFAIRSIRAYPGHPSAHSWGCAIDLEPATNQLGTVGTMDPGVVACFKEAGFTWGGDFRSRTDPMHFSLLGF
jgi:hypothetical protein